MMTAFIILAGAAAFYMAWNIGANDVANAMGTSVGSKALTLRQAIVVAAVFEFAGAMLVGTHVTETVQNGIVNPRMFAGLADGPQTLMFGMFAALAASGLWLNLATRLGMPVSTTHSIVGAIFGVGLVTMPASINWGVVLQIAASWVVSPILGGAFAFVAFKLLTRTVLSRPHPGLATRKTAPVLTALVVTILCLSIIHKVLGKAFYNWGLTSSTSLPESAAFLISIFIGTCTFLVVKAKINGAATIALDGEHQYVERIFRRMQVMTGCYVAFAHGANDVANAIAPLATIWDIYSSRLNGLFTIPDRGAQVSMLMLLFGGVGIVTGLATYGYRVIETVGRKITEMIPSRGFTAEFATATVVLVFSRWIAMPISTTHVLVGAVFGVGLARGIAALNLRVINSIMASWVITLPASAILTIILFYLARWIFI